MADVTIEVTDNSEIFKDAKDEAIAKALETIGLVAEGYAKRLAPVDTGRLRNSISHARDEDSAYIGTNVEYAPYVEFGTKRQTAQPYLKPAVLDHVSEYKDIVQQILKEA